eukprot:s119_g89.t1
MYGSITGQQSLYVRAPIARSLVQCFGLNLVLDGSDHRLVDQVGLQVEKCNGFRVELQRRLQLVEFLVRTWKCDEITNDRDALRSLDATQVQLEVDQACDVFKRFNNQLEDGQERLQEHYLPAETGLVDLELKDFSEALMEREISLILDYFGGQQSRGSLIPRRLERLFSTSSTGHTARQKELLEAFQAHMVAQILWDFEEDPWETLGDLVGL